MLALRLHGPRTLRLDSMDALPAPGAGEVLLEVGAVGLCGSDLHLYHGGGIGGLAAEEPLVLGHEFMGTVVVAGPGAHDGTGRPLAYGQRVAVDPAQACGACENCREGHPNLCPTHLFLGVPPDDGALRPRMIVPGESCFRLPDSIDNAGGALLETLGVALHAIDLAKLEVGRSVAVIGCGPVGLLILKLAAMAGANPLFAFDPLPHRRALALEFGASAVWPEASGDALAEFQKATGGRGCDVAIEAAWADASVQQTLDTVRYGGRVVLVGIPEDDRCLFSHATARRKGLTVRFSRRMKHSYPRALRIATSAAFAGVFPALVTHRFPLSRALEAFALNLRYGDGVHKIIIEPNA